MCSHANDLAPLRLTDLLGFSCPGGLFKILGQNELRHDVLAKGIAEAGYVGMGVGYYGFGFVGILNVIVYFCFQVGIVGSHFYVVIVGYQRAFHKPRFVFGTRHYGD